MSTTASLPATPRHRSSCSEATAPPPPTARPGSDRQPTPSPVPRSHEATSMFRVSFASAMSDPDITRLARTLELATHMHPKLHNSPVSLGVARLDFDSGVFLERGPGEGRWILEGRTWGHPPPETVHDWHLRAADAAHGLDPTVTLPTRLTAVASGIAGRPLGRAASKHSAGLGRRLLMRLR